jgi:hypothetical protein
MLQGFNRTIDLSSYTSFIVVNFCKAYVNLFLVYRVFANGAWIKSV